MAILTKSQILAANDKKLVEIELNGEGEWGGSVMIRVMSGSERDRFESDFVGGNKTVENVRAKLVAKCVCDAEGVRLFSEEEVPQLGEKSAAVLDKLFSACMRHNRFTKEDVDELGKAS
jgi:hypothetical protein